MWLITPTGFFSIVEKPSDKKADTLTVRARVRSDLVALRKDYLPSLGRIRESLDTDYRYRATGPRPEVGKALAQMAATLNYANFKSEVAMRQGPERARVYHDVWEVLHDLQADPAVGLRPVRRRARR